MFGRTVRFYLGGETGTLNIFVFCSPETPWAEIVEKARRMIQSALLGCRVSVEGLEEPVKDIPR